MIPSKGKPRGYRKDRDCLTCKDRKIKCDLNRPSCGPCSESGAHCRGYDVSLQWVYGVKIRRTKSTAANLASCSAERKAVATKNDVSPGEVPATQEFASSQTVHQRLHALNDLAFPTKVPRKDSEEVLQAWDWSTDYKQYLQVFAGNFARAKAAMASRGEASSECDIDAVWELVSMRISGPLQKNCRDSNETSFISLHAQALNEIGRAIGRGDILAMFGIVTLSYLDIYEGPFVDSERHLRGARALLDSHGSSPEMLDELYQQVPGLKQAISLLVWYDVMEGFLKNKKTIIFEEWHRKSVDDDFFHMVSCPRDTFELYAMVIKARSGEMSEPLTFVALQQALLANQNSERTDPSNLLQNSWRYGAVVAAIGLSGSSALPGFDETMAMLTDRLCDTIERMPIESGHYRHLICHTTILGTQSQTPRHQLAVDTYWKTCQSLPIPIFLKGRDHIDPHWKRVLHDE